MRTKLNFCWVAYVILVTHFFIVTLFYVFTVQLREIIGVKQQTGLSKAFNILGGVHFTLSQ